MTLAWRAVRAVRALRDPRLIEGKGGGCCVLEGKAGRRCLLEPCHGEEGVVCWRLVEAVQRLWRHGLSAAAGSPIHAAV